jgi:hypothetical protein
MKNIPLDINRESQVETTPVNSIVGGQVFLSDEEIEWGCNKVTLDLGELILDGFERQGFIRHMARGYLGKVLLQHGLFQRLPMEKHGQTVPSTHSTCGFGWMERDGKSRKTRPDYARPSCSTGTRILWQEISIYVLHSIMCHTFVQWIYHDLRLW